MKTWIDFKQLRRDLDFEQVLKHYGVEVKRKEVQHHGFCPLPGHKGKRNSASFSANLERGIFQCFGCGAKGNVLEFAALMENVDPADGTELRKVAGQLQEKFCTAAEAVERKAETPDDAETNNDAPVVINAPLDFTLKGLDATHPYLLGRGFTQETIAYFGLGFCSRGMLKDRVAIPLHDQREQLIGYAGRVIDDAAITDENPRYRFPSKRNREGTAYEFRKSLFLYNGYRIAAPVDDLVVVEGFTSVWWLHQNGVRNVVATMGADCSETQAELIVSLVKTDGRVWLIPDGDTAGERCTESLLRQIAPHRFVRWVKLVGNRQPTDCARDEIEHSLGLPVLP